MTLSTTKSWGEKNAVWLEECWEEEKQSEVEDKTNLQKDKTVQGKVHKILKVVPKVLEVPVEI